jgi:hypothetical protein
MSTEVGIELPKYKCHKEVWALKIKEVRTPDPKEGVGPLLTFEDPAYAPIRVSPRYAAKHLPQAGGYYVVYKDGYQSWSPAKEFEEGYTRIT